MIYFEKEIKPFKTSKGMKVNPIPCELKDSRKGYYLGYNWKEEIEAKGATTELIKKEDLKIEEI